MYHSLREATLRRESVSQASGATVGPLSHSTHVRNVGLKSSDDPLVWQFAIDNDFVLVSKDADMHDRSLVFGFPPKIIWIRLGNCTTAAIDDLVRREIDTISEFLDDDYASFLALSK